MGCYVGILIDAQHFSTSKVSIEHHVRHQLPPVCNQHQEAASGPTPHIKNLC